MAPYRRWWLVPAAAANPVINYDPWGGRIVRAMRPETDQNLTGTLYQAVSQPSATISVLADDRGKALKTARAIDPESAPALLSVLPITMSVPDRVLALGKPAKEEIVYNPSFLTPPSSPPATFSGDRTFRLAQPKTDDPAFNLSFMVTQTLPVGQQAPEWSKSLRTLVRDVEQNLTATLYQQITPVVQKLLALVGVGN